MLQGLVLGVGLRPFCTAPRCSSLSVIPAQAGIYAPA